MSLRRPAYALLALTVLYAAALLWAESKNQVLGLLPAVSAVLPALAGAALLSIALRYLRWKRLLNGAGHPIPPLRGFLAYCSGFAFTASPGKAGELFRIRYHTPLGVSPARVVSAFIYERACDLICVLILATLFMATSPLLGVAAAFVFLILAFVVISAKYPYILSRVAGLLPASIERRLAPFVRTLEHGLKGTAFWWTWRDTVSSLAYGFAAWGLLAVAFAWLLMVLEIDVPPTTAVAIYPLAMLAGAASMIPGGVGSTEAVIIAVLGSLGAGIHVATLAAVGIRLATLWFAILLGMAATSILEVWKPNSSMD